MSRGKPFMLGKYEAVRMRNSLAEGWATGGSGMGLYMNVMDPAGFDNATRYLSFVRDRDRLYRVRRPFAEVALVLPRQSIAAGRRASLDTFRSLGQALLERHVLLDVVADETMTPARLACYKAVILPPAPNLSDAQCAMLEDAARCGGALLVSGTAATLTPAGNVRARPGLFDGTVSVDLPLLRPVGQGRLLWLPAGDAAKAVVAFRALADGLLSSFRAPWTLRVSAYAEPRRLVLHFVNYNRDEVLGSKGKGPEAEHPVAEEGVEAAVRLSQDVRVKRVRAFSPDEDTVHALEFRHADGVLRFRLPPVLVYTVVEVGLSRRGAALPAGPPRP
jgi:hypothetical protein